MKLVVIKELFYSVLPISSVFLIFKFNAICFDRVIRWNGKVDEINILLILSRASVTTCLVVVLTLQVSPVVAPVADRSVKTHVELIQTDV